MYTKRLSERQIPTAWKNAKMMIIFNKGNKKDLKNYKPICLLSNFCKVLTKILYEYPPLSIARYSFIQLSELEQCRVEQFAQAFTRLHRIQTWVLVVESPNLYRYRLKSQTNTISLEGK